MNAFILMADVVKSSEQLPEKLINELKAVVDWTNKIFAGSIESPLTITLGDEFQGIVGSASEGVDIILAIEEHIIEEEYDFKLRYVLHEGEVSTKVNPEKAYEMLGEGLTIARKLLGEMKKDAHRFLVKVDGLKKVNKMMRIIQHFIDGWHPKDRSTVSGFLQGYDYKALARMHQKDDSTLWRRRKSLAIDEYLLSKDVLQHLVNG